MPEGPLHTRLCVEYGCEYPIVAFSATVDVVIAASDAGAIGMYDGSPLSVDELRASVRSIKERVGDKPFGVDLILPPEDLALDREQLEARIPATHRAFVDRLMRDNELPEPKTPGPYGSREIDALVATPEKLAVLREEGVPIFVARLTPPVGIVDEMRATGVRVWAACNRAEDAQAALDAGVDALVAEGQDASSHSLVADPDEGGAIHVGPNRVGTFSVIPELAELARERQVPVIAAGGVSTGRHIIAALALGAVGVWAATAFRATEEADIDPRLKQRLVEAANQDAWQPRGARGAQNRELRNKLLDAWEQPDAPQPLPLALQAVLMAKVEQAIRDWQLEDWMAVPAGQGVSFVREIKPTKQVIADLVADAETTANRLSFADVEDA